MPAKTLLVNVPVERLVIVNANMGPDEMFLFMGLAEDSKLRVVFNLQISGSNVTFQQVATITKVRPAVDSELIVVSHSYDFEGLFGDQPIIGHFRVFRHGYIMPA